MDKIYIFILIICIAIAIVLFYNRTESRENIFLTSDEYPELCSLEENWKIIASEIPPFDTNKLYQYPKRNRSAWNNEEGKDLADKLKSTWV